MKSLKYIFIAAASLCVGCGGSTTPTKSESTTTTKEVSTEKVEIKNEVDTMHLRRQSFNKQINCNGKLRAVAVSDLNLPTAGILNDVRVRNGSYVKKGDLIAAIDTEEFEFSVKRCKREVEMRYIELMDDLISLGYSQDTTQVPSHILKRAKSTSGYYTALDQLESAKYKLSKCFLYAPFAGRVANIENNLHEKNTNLFCRLIDDSYFDVEFNILEAEISMSKVGESVIVFPFIDENKCFKGKITEINPVVDDRGQVKVCAKIKNRDGYLVEGMNVRVIMENNEPNMFVVPKDAVILRDGVYVMFRLEDGMALWTYVDVLHSNLDSYAIAGNKKKRTVLKNGDVVITSGNLNLSDGTPVVARAPKVTPQQQQIEAAKKRAEAAKRKAAAEAKKKAAAEAAKKTTDTTKKATVQKKTNAKKKVKKVNPNNKKAAAAKKQ